jgi:hypothetical protein
MVAATEFKAVKEKKKIEKRKVQNSQHKKLCRLAGKKPGTGDTIRTNTIRRSQPS